jgi:hypothetical protein
MPRQEADGGITSLAEAGGFQVDNSRKEIGAEATVLRIFGGILWILAAYLIFLGYRIETTVAVPDAPLGFDGIANLQALHMQAMHLHLGVGAAIVGAVLIGAAAVVSALSRS